jgi:DNA-directed RNA polymerase beta' subunit
MIRGDLPQEKPDNGTIPYMYNTMKLKQDSLFDPRLGTGNHSGCVICGLNNLCVGHFGYIQLEEPLLKTNIDYAFIPRLLKNLLEDRKRLKEELRKLSESKNITGIKRKINDDQNDHNKVPKTE